MRQHSTALVESETVAPSACFEAFCRVLPGAVVGEQCSIGSHVLVGQLAHLHEGVIVQHGAVLEGAVELEAGVTVGPNVAFITSSTEPDAKTVVRKGAAVGANAVVSAGVTIGPNACVEAGTVVTRDVPPNSIVSGNPARIVGYVSTSARQSMSDQASAPVTPLTKLEVKGACLHRLPLITDLRGSLSFGEIGQHLPFTPKRYFLVFNVPGREIRGEHAHKQCHQFLVCVKGSCHVVVDDGINREEIVLSEPTVGLHIAPMVWGIQYKYSEDAVLLVLASDVYSGPDYIRVYDDFLQQVSLAPPQMATRVIPEVQRIAISE